MASERNAEEYLRVLQNINEEDSASNSEEYAESDENSVREIITSTDESDSESYLESGPATPASLSNIELGRDGTEWMHISSQAIQGRRSIQNVLRTVPGPTAYAKRMVASNSVLSVFQTIFTESMLKIIMECTVIHAQSNNINWAMTVEDVLIVIALMYARGILGLRSMPIKSCWSKEWGAKIFQDLMPRDRFLDIMKHLRFDKKTARSARLQTDRFALASDIWNPFIANSRACYNPGESVTVDEQLYPTKCRCKFIQYMANKPDKFGIKYWLLADVKFSVNKHEK